MTNSRNINTEIQHRLHKLNQGIGRQTGFKMKKQSGNAKTLIKNSRKSSRKLR